MISHMADYQVFHLDHPWGHHLMALVLHVANSVLLFLVLARMTGRDWPSFFVAALFAWHPIHVESVAWVSERKDVLSAFFWLLTMAAYLRYVQNRTWQRYCLVIPGLARKRGPRSNVRSRPAAPARRRRRPRSRWTQQIRCSYPTG